MNTFSYQGHEAGHADQQYLALVRDIMANGEDRMDRTGVGTKALFAREMRFDLQRGFPLLTTKKVHVKSIILELIWFLRGEHNNNWLKERGCSIWDEWAKPDGELGPVYGKQWRDWVGPNGQHIDQIQALIHSLKTNPTSRRHIVSAWNVGEIEQMALPPCHAFFQCFVSKGKLSLKLYQRSMDVALGCPFNIASYALLTHMLAQLTGYEVGEFIHSTGDTHIYSNHEEGLKEQLTRQPMPLPTLKMPGYQTLEEMMNAEWSDFKIEGYQSHPSIKFDVAT
jgi:thymidylate synthase